MSENLIVSLVRYIFDEVIEGFPCTKPILSVTARIMHNSEFENGTVKIMERKESDLIDEEKAQNRLYFNSP